MKRFTTRIILASAAVIALATLAAELAHLAQGARP